MDAARVLELVSLLESRRVRVWLDGGWAIDALIGEQRRSHDDLDLISDLEEVPALEAALNELGYVTRGGGAPQSFEMVDAEGHQVDVHPASFTADGDGHYQMESGEDWIFPKEGFKGTGRLLDRDVPCMTPDTTLRNHSTGYALDETHEADVVALCEHFGLPLPPFEKAAR